MGDFNTKTLLKPKPIVTKQLLQLRDSRPGSARTRPQQDLLPLNSNKEVLQLRVKKVHQLSIGKTLLQLRPSRCDSRRAASKSRASSPHSISSGYATEDHDYNSDHHDGDSSSGSRNSVQHGESSWKSNTQLVVKPRRMAEAAWTPRSRMHQNGHISPVVNSRMCAPCRASGRSTHSAMDCPLRRRHLFQ